MRVSQDIYEDKRTRAHVLREHINCILGFPILQEELFSGVRDGVMMHNKKRMTPGI